MFLFRGAVGLVFHRKIFRISSFGGKVIDDVLEACVSSRVLKGLNFDRVNWPLSENSDTKIILSDPSKKSSLTLTSGQIVLKVSTQSDESSIDTNNMIRQFNEVWKLCDKILDFPAIRRIGIVGEYRIREKKAGTAGGELIQALTKMAVPKDTGHFQMNYSEREIFDTRAFDNKTSDYSNTIYSFYLSEMDETPKHGFMHANVDFQRYFNPAKINALAELSNVKEDYLKKKNMFKSKLAELGLVDAKK